MRLLLMAVLCILILPVVHPVYADFSILNQSSYVDESNILHVLGEVQNKSNEAMENILITISFYDGEGNLLDEFQRSPALRTINSGEYSPFEITFIESKLIDKVANFTLSVQGQETKAKDNQIRIISSSSRLDLLGTYYINAAARNEGSLTATNVIMIGTLYDRDSRVLAIGSALAEAAPGSTNMTTGSEAPFGISITEKTQTYKAARYSLVVDSDQYMSERVSFVVPNVGASSTQTKSGCLIATAAFGSALAPQVQELRVFRDNIVLNTFAGSSFMNVFDSWYYSFSPSVAEYERQTPTIQNVVRVGIYPLLITLDLSTEIYNLVTFSSELGIVLAGITASLLIGLLYFAPFGAIFALVDRKRQRDTSKIWKTLIIGWILSLTIIVVGEIAVTEPIMMLGTSMLVLTALFTVIIGIWRILRS